MGCINAPTLPVPTIGGGLSIDITIPAQSFSVGLCCKTIAFGTPTLHVPLGVVPPGLNAIIAAQIKIIQTFLDSLPPTCPRE